MSEYNIVKREGASILVLEEINYNFPFILLEMVDFNNSIKCKVRYADNDLNTVISTYFKLKKITDNPLLIVNSVMNDIADNPSIFDAITTFYNNH